LCYPRVLTHMVVSISGLSIQRRHKEDIKKILCKILKNVINPRLFFHFLSYFPDYFQYISYYWYIFSMCKGIPLVKNDFLVKPELSASRVLLFSLPWAAVDASLAHYVRSARFASRRKGHIRTYRCIGYIKVLIRHKGCYNIIIYAEPII